MENINVKRTKQSIKVLGNRQFLSRESLFNKFNPEVYGFLTYRPSQKVTQSVRLSVFHVTKCSSFYTLVHSPLGICSMFGISMLLSLVNCLLYTFNVTLSETMFSRWLQKLIIAMKQCEQLLPILTANLLIAVKKNNIYLTCLSELWAILSSRSLFPVQ